MRAILLTFCFLLCSSLWADGVVLKDPEAVYELGLNLEILEDKDGRISWEDVRGGRYEEQFQVSESPIPNYGFTPSVYWVRFSVKNLDEHTRWLLQANYPPLDYIQVYDLQGTVWRKRELGDRFVFGKREIIHRTHIVRLDLPPGKITTIYMRFESEGTLQFPLRLLRSETLRRIDHNQQFVLGWYYGIIILLSLYNLILFFTVRDLSFLYYFLYVSGYGCIQFILNGLAYEYFWPNWPWWANRSLPFSIGWTFFWSLQFARTLLSTRIIIPVLDRFLQLLMGAMVFLMGSSLILNYYFNISLSALLVISFSIAMVITAVVADRRGLPSARYFLIAWFALLFGVTIYALKGFGFLPANLMTEYGLQIGSAIEMILLSMGLGVRMNHLSLEKEEAKTRTVEALQLQQETQLHSTRLEIELLKKNIQPHFLMNTINATIIWVQEDPKSAEKLLHSLAEELRMLLEFSSRKLITMTEEINLCQAHLGVMSLRHDKEFCLKTENLKGSQEIPPLVFHTMIENGLTHGFSGKDEGNFLLSRRTEADGSTVFTLFNDGSPKSNSKSSSPGLGMQYVRTRLAEVFGDKWKLDSGPLENGWLVTLRILP